ncbi:DUF2889 domain-containing protein [Parafrankia sp. FMc2]|uniref:DUF2889 domain-containing protein n=1 Tax=Parafrankia sp. FMc2 TaxID=3233196 RepID=UPI0034D5B065
MIEVPPPPEGAAHRRSIIMDSYPADNGHVTVVGRLTDQIPRAAPGQQRIHDMTLALTVRLAGLVITAAEADMTAFPHTECPLIAPAFARLEGLSVARGFTRELRQRLGGASGCSHLGELARAMGPAVVRTATEQLAHTRRGKSPESAGPPPLPLGTCHVWAADGAGPLKIEAGWVPGSVDRPIPPVAHFRNGSH